MLFNVYGTEWPILCWCAVKKLLTHPSAISFQTCSTLPTRFQRWKLRSPIEHVTTMYKGWLCVTGLLSPQESEGREACSREAICRVVGQEEGATGHQRWIWWRESWLHCEPRRTLAGPIRDRLAHWKRFLWTGNLLTTIHSVVYTIWTMALKFSLMRASFENCYSPRVPVIFNKLVI